jgi:hypothetical protein
MVPGLITATTIPELPLPFPHTCFRSFLGDRLIGKDADPYLATAFHGTVDGDTGGFDLLGGHLAAHRRFKRVFAERDG